MPKGSGRGMKKAMTRGPGSVEVIVPMILRRTCRATWLSPDHAGDGVKATYAPLAPADLSAWARPMRLHGTDRRLGRPQHVTCPTTQPPAVPKASCDQIRGG